MLKLLEISASKQGFRELLQTVERLPSAQLRRIDWGKVASNVAHLRARIDHYRQRERELLALYDTTFDLNSLRSTDHVLRAIVHRARRLLRSDIGYLSVYDADRNDFYVRAHEGVVTETFSHTRIPRGVGTCRYIADNKAAFFSSGYSNDTRFSHDPGVDAAIIDEGIVSLLGVPLLLEQRVLGILFIADRHSRSYLPQEIAVLSSLATHAGLAIENARLFEDARSSLQQAHGANERLRVATAEVQAAATAHERMTALVARGGTLEDLATMMGATLEGRVTILDEELYPIHDANRIGPDSDHSPPQRSVDTRIRRALAESRSSGHSTVAFAAEEVCRVAAVSSGTEIIGGLVIRTREDLSDAGVRIFERGAMVTGIVLLSRDRAAQAEFLDIAEFLTQLFRRPQASPTLLIRQADRYGVDFTRPTMLFLLDFEGRRPGYASQLLRTVAMGKRIIAAEHDGELVVIAPAEGAVAMAGILQKAIRPKLGFAPNVILSKEVRAVSELPSAYEAAKQCLALMRRLGKKSDMDTVDNLAVYSILFSDKGVAEIDAFVRGTIGAILKHDETRSVALSDTLLAYLENGYDTRETAKKLNIHPNTLRQRLDTLDAVLGNWREHNRAFEIHVALRLRRLRSSPEGT